MMYFGNVQFENDYLYVCQSIYNLQINANSCNLTHLIRLNDEKIALNFICFVLKMDIKLQRPDVIDFFNFILLKKNNTSEYTQQIIQTLVQYNDSVPDIKNRKIYSWKEFMEIRKKANLQDEVYKRAKKLQLGNCCTLIYTNGTTGNSKGVMLSHDNYMYTIVQNKKCYKIGSNQYSIVSYLSFSHVAAQLVDLMGIIGWCGHFYFANPDASLQNSLINTLREVRPTFFLDVPRVWEKIYEEMQKVVQNNGSVQTTIAQWAKSKGKQVTFAQTHNLQQQNVLVQLKKLVYYQVKKALGLDQAQYMLFGAAPLSPEIRYYFYLQICFQLMHMAVQSTGRSVPQPLQCELVFQLLDEFIRQFIVIELYQQSIYSLQLKFDLRQTFGKTKQNELFFRVSSLNFLWICQYVFHFLREIPEFYSHHYQSLQVSIKFFSFAFQNDSNLYMFEKFLQNNFLLYHSLKLQQQQKFFSFSRILQKVFHFFVHIKLIKNQLLFHDYFFKLL